MSKQDNIEIFNDTHRIYTSNPYLVNAVKKSILTQELFANDHLHLEQNTDSNIYSAKILVSPKRTLEATATYAGKEVCILNFASATNPGGGVTKGSSAQEEAICRCSTLFPCLNAQKMWKGFYVPHRSQRNPLHNDDCIYTPNVVVFKSDTRYPKLLSKDNWYFVNVLTCAAPNLRKKPSNDMNSGDGKDAVTISQSELQALHEKRMRKVLEIASIKGNKVVILGAFGCGAFCNPPQIVAQAMKAVVQEYRTRFETIEFAVYCTAKDDTNYRIFQSILGDL